MMTSHLYAAPCNPKFRVSDSVRDGLRAHFGTKIIDCIIRYDDIETVLLVMKAINVDGIQEFIEFLETVGSVRLTEQN